jgi:hypothetical protein
MAALYFGAKIGIKNKKGRTEARPLQIVKFVYASAVSNATIETNERLSFFLRNSTIPSVKAYNVWSFPIPTFSPG